MTGRMVSNCLAVRLGFRLRAVVSAPAAWFILKELASLLRPLLLATLFCSAILPIHKRLHRGYSNTATIVIMSAGALFFVIMLGLLIYSSAIEFNDDLPRLSARAHHIAEEIQNWSDAHLPEAASRSVKDALRIESRSAERLSEASQSILKYAADILVEMFVVGLYVVFLLFEAKRLGRRLEAGVQSDQSAAVRETVQTINKAPIVMYARAILAAADGLVSIAMALPPLLEAP